jgi:mRNA interferase RelE/StbE
MFAVEYSKQAEKSLKKIDKYQRSLIKKWIEKNLMGCVDPRAHGKLLTGKLAGKWRYRVGCFRILAAINDNTVTIFTINVGHRREVYDEGI